jgi:hypothetical protein
MELLIPGLILVALMVYASTRIKRSAAQAFEPETVETDAFSINKPEGFLNVINGDPQYAFEAYSKTFEEENGRDVRAATARLRILDGKAVGEQIAEIKNAELKVTSEQNEVMGDIRYHVIEGTRDERGAEFRMLYKLAESAGKTYELEVKALASAEETAKNAETFIDSFEVK